MTDSLSGGKKMHRNSSLGTIFIHRVTPSDLDVSVEKARPDQNYSRVHSLPTLASMTINASVDVGTLRSTSLQSASSSDGTPRQSSLKQLSFADLNLVRLNDLLMGRTDSSSSNLTSEEMVQLTIESESQHEREHVAAQNDKELCKYVEQTMAGFLHVPFSTLIGAAPILHSRTFSSLKAIAWENLLSVDVELSQTAGSFFLLAAAKENEKQMKGFVKSRILNQSPMEKKNAILRFKVLWECRYGVWSRMEERAQKKFVHNEKEIREKEKTIGYSQLANPLGDQGDYLPLSPGEPVSVCTSKACADNPDKCYRSTKIAPVIHPKEISGSVHTFPVSGVSIPQEVGGTRSSSVVYKVDSDEVAGAREYEAIDPTLFPNSLLPLIRFLLFSLVPSNNRHASKSSSSSSASTSRTSSETTSTGSSLDQLEDSELARQVVWSCMVEDPRLFFRPLLNNFNKLYTMGEEKKHNVETLIAETLEPFHIVLQEFPKLPSRAAHMLLNNFVGVVLQHTDQPYSLSTRVIHSVLTLVSMVTSSVQGLDMKLLKSYLKKESCYTTIMATARIRGVDRVLLVPNHTHYEPRLYKVTDNDMTFGHLIAEACQPEELSLKLLSRWYLVDKCTDLPVLSTLVVQDHYSAPTNKSQHPTFILHKVKDSPEKFWSDEMDRLFVFKMNEVVKVLFSTQLLLTGPEVEKTYTYSEYALPNYQFMHKELVELNSFPRKALMSVQHEAGPNAFQNVQLRASDVMLKGMWVRFVMQLIVSAGRDYDWSNSLPLFMNVVNGSLLLHSEDHTILYFCLSTMLLTAAKFNSVFKKDGYMMIVPALIQVYSLHMKNKVITSAIRFMWLKFYTLDRNHFISQFMAASSTLLSEEVASLAHNIGSTNLTGILTRTSRMEAEEARRLTARALFELNGVLVSDPGHVKDELQIMRCCKDHLDLDLLARLENRDSSQCLSLKETTLLAIVFAGWNPEAIRGMQVLVYVDHMMPLFLPILGSREQKFITDSLQYLVKKCESISKPIQVWVGGDIFSRKAGNPKADKSGSKGLKPGQSFAEDDVVDHPPRKTRKVSVVEVVTKILYNPNRKDRHKASSSRITFASPGINEEGEGLESGGQEADNSSQTGHSSRQNQSRQARYQGTEQEIFQLSRNALLSAVSEVFAYYCRRVGRGVSVGVSPTRKFSIQLARTVSSVEASSTPTKISLDSGSVLVIINIVCQMLKQGAQKEELLQSPGLNNVFVHFLYGLDWTEQHFSAFGNLLYRLARLFKQLQRDSSKAIMLWDNLANFITSLTVCVHHNPQLVRGQDQHLTRLKGILETLIAMQSSRSEPQAVSTMHKKIKSMQQPLLSSAPPSFAEAVVGLAVELIVITSGPQNAQLTHSKFRYRIADLVTQKLLKEHEDFLMPKIVLPLCIQLGLRGGGWEVAQEDVDFFMQFIDSKIEIFHRLKHSPEIPDQVFRVLKVFCCSFSESFSMQQWTRVSHWITSLFMRKLSVSLATGKRTSSISLNNKGGERGREKMRAARLPSASGSAGTPLEVFISFHENLLSFFEDFVVHCRVPLLPLLQPILWKMGTQLEMAKQNMKVDNPGHLEKVTVCINRCHRLKEGSLTISRFRNRQQLLQELQDMLKSISTQNSGRVTLLRSHTTIDNNQRSKKSVSRRMSDVGKNSNLGNIKEDLDSEGLVNLSLSLPRQLSVSDGKSPSSRKSRSPNSKKQEEKRPNTLSLKPPKSVSIEDMSSPTTSADITLYSPPSTTALSPSPRSALRKRSPDRRTRPRFQGSMESLDEEEDTREPLDKNLSPRYLPPPPRGGGKSGKRSPKLGELGKKGPIDSIEYPGDVEDDDVGEDVVVLENSMTQTPSPRPRRFQSRGKEEGGSILVNPNATSDSPYLTKKRVAFSSESKSESLSLPLRTVQVEVHYDPPDKNDEDENDKKYGSHEREKMESRETRDGYSQVSKMTMLETNITSKTALLPSHLEKSRNSEVKPNNFDGASVTVKPVSPRNRSATTSGFSDIKQSLSQTNVVGDDDDDRNQLLKYEAHQRTDRRDFPYQMWHDASGERESKFSKSQSLDRGYTHSAGSAGSGSHFLTTALKEGTKFLYRRGQRSSSEQDMNECDHIIGDKL